MSFLRNNSQLFIAIFLGTIVGLAFPDFAILLDPLGVIFLNLLKMLIFPVVFTSIILGIVSLGNVRELGRIGRILAVFFLGSTTIAAVLGVAFGRLFFSTGTVPTSFVSEITDANSIDINSVSGLVSELVPENIFGSIANGSSLPLLFFALLLGSALLAIGSKKDAFVQLTQSFHDALIKIVDWIMKIAPVGIFALIGSLYAQTGIELIKPLAVYFTVVLLTLGTHAIVVLPLILLLFTRQSPLTLLRQVSPALAMAFSTSSSLVTLPILMECLKKRSQLSSRIVNFICPIGATINMDGTAIFQAATTLFIASLYGIHLTLGQLALVILATTLASIGSAAIPSAGLLTLVIVLNIVHIPIEGIGVILAADRVLDMFRTTVNVFSDSVCASIVNRYETKNGL